MVLQGVRIYKARHTSPIICTTEGFGGIPRSPNYPLIYPKIPVSKGHKGSVKGPWGVLVGNGL